MNLQQKERAFRVQAEHPLLSNCLKICYKNDHFGVNKKIKIK